MTDFLKAIPSIIKEAAKSVLGVLSLMILLIFFIAISFFNEEDTIVKIFIFFLLFLGVVLFGLSVYKAKSPTEKITGAASDLIKKKGTLNVSKFLIIFVMICSVALLALYNLYWQPQYRFYEQIRRTPEGWVGVSKITPSEAKKHNSFFKFSFRGYWGIATTVEILNGSGGLSTSNIDEIFGNMLIKECSDVRAVKVEFTYGDSGLIQRETFIDQSKRPLLNIDYSDKADKVKFNYSQWTSCSKGRSPVTGAKLFFYEKQSGSFIKRIEFCNDNFENVADQNSIFGYEFEYDNEHRILKKIFLGLGKPKIIAEYGYNHLNHLEQESYWTSEGNKTSIEGVHSKVFKNDIYGNLTEETFYNQEGAIGFNSRGISIIKNKIDDLGNVVEIAYYNELGRLINDKEGYSITRIKYGSKGEELEECYFDINNMATFVSVYGYSMIKFGYDKDQRIVSKSYYDSMRRPMLRSEGYHEERIIYNKGGYMTEIKNFGLHNNLVTTSTVGAILKNEFNEHGFRTSITWADENGNLMYQYDIKNDKPTGVSKIRYQYDKYGLLEETSFYNHLDKLVSSANLGYAKSKHVIRDGREIEAHYFDANDQYVNNEYALRKTEYDKNGKIESTTDFERPNVPMEKQRPFKTKYFYDEHDLLIRTEYYDKDENFDMVGGYCLEKKEYDPYGRVTKKAFYDSTLQLKKEGYSSVNYKYDRYGNIVETRYFDQNYALIKTGIAIQKNKFNDKGYITEILNFNYEEKLTPDSDGVSIYLYQWDILGRNRSRRCFRSLVEPVNSNQGYHKFICKYDSCGRNTIQSFFGINGLPILIEKEYSTIKRSFNRFGQIIQEEYYDDLCKKSALVGDAYDNVKFTYDERGYQLSRTFYKNDTLVKNNFGISIIKEVRDETNKLLEKYYFDEKEKPVNSSQGFHKTIYHYDRFQNSTEEKYDLKGNKV